MKHSILLLEGNQQEGQALIARLRQMLGKIEVEWCTSPEEAFGALFWGQWDLIFMNYELARENRMELLKRVKALTQNSQTKTIVYHGSQQPDDSHQILGEGISALVSLHDVMSARKDLPNLI